MGVPGQGILLPACSSGSEDPLQAAFFVVRIALDALPLRPFSSFFRADVRAALS